MNLKFKAAGITDVGRRRDRNEDSIFLSEDFHLYVVADGMGGHAAGDVASAKAVEAVQSFITRSRAEDTVTWPFGSNLDLNPGERVLHTAVMLANREVCSLAEKNAELGGMGTTVAAVYLIEDQAHVCHVGDSRVYLYRDGELRGITEDHSWVNEQVQRKLISEDEARNHRWRNVITRALGSRSDVEIDVQTLEARAGDQFLICSDGLTTMLDDDVIGETLALANGDPRATCANLIDQANEAGGLDNVSVVIILAESDDQT